MKSKLLTLTLSAILALSLVGTAMAAPNPPTQGGNGAGSSGQCTGKPSERPAVCPAT